METLVQNSEQSAFRHCPQAAAEGQGEAWGPKASGTEKSFAHTLPHALTCTHTHTHTHAPVSRLPPCCCSHRPLCLEALPNPPPASGPHPGGLLSWPAGPGTQSLLCHGTHAPCDNCLCKCPHHCSFGTSDCALSSICVLPGPEQGPGHGCGMKGRVSERVWAGPALRAGGAGPGPGLGHLCVLGGRALCSLACWEACRGVRMQSGRPGASRCPCWDPAEAREHRHWNTRLSNGGGRYKLSQPLASLQASGAVVGLWPGDVEHRRGYS